MTLKLALTGTGYINKIHARAAQKIEGVVLSAVVNHRAESMAAFAGEFGIARQYSTVAEMLADGGVDAVIISTPNYLHAPQTIAALEAGVHILVEKPMAMNAAQARSMQAVAQESGAQLMVAHCWRFDEEVRWLKARTTKLGRVIRTKGYGVHSNWGPGGWFTQRKYAGGGALADMGIHAIDTVRFLLGDPQPLSVYARIGTFYGNFDVDDTGVILITWENGVTSYIESGWWQPHSDGPEACTQLYGTHGFGQIFPTRMELPDPEKEHLDVIEGGFPFPRPEHCPQEMYDRQMAYFVESIRQNKIPIPGAAEGIVNLQIIDAAYQSAQTGQVVEIA